MIFKVLWPGKTNDKEVRHLIDSYIKKINRLDKCQLIQTKEAKGIPEKHSSRIMEIESSGLEKYFNNDYIICLFHKGKQMDSMEFARFLEKTSLQSARIVTFVVGGFLGLEERILKRADFLLSLSKMTFSHELSRLMLLEQLYRALTIIKGRQYAK